MIDTRGMSAEDWTARTTILIQQYGSIPKLLDEKKWQSWAATVTNLPYFASIGVPRPELFHDWQSWATRFNQVVRTAGGVF